MQLEQLKSRLTWLSNFANTLDSRGIVLTVNQSILEDKLNEFTRLWDGKLETDKLTVSPFDYHGGCHF